MRIISLQQRKAAYMCVIAATKLVWTAVILNGSEASGPLANGKALKMYT